MRAMNSHGLKEVAVLPEYIVALRMQQFTLLNLPPCMSMAETQPLPEIAEEVQHPNGGQKFGHLLLLGFCSLSASTFSSPMMMGYIPGKRLRASYRSGKCSRWTGEGYAPMRAVQCAPEKISQLTMFGLWNHVDSMSDFYSLSLMTSPTLHFTLLRPEV